MREISGFTSEFGLNQNVMKRILQIIALAVVLAAASVWIATGANRGWTKTSVPVKTLDEVLGIEGIRYKKRFVPGLDFLGIAVLGAGTLAGGSLLFRKKPKTEMHQ